ncbi:MAG TPA: transglutaminase domain-containing protein [Mycobacteriales bacterium]|nr:transglutaminase domain-containing protein [Mycobacteriales bacterium]
MTPAELQARTWCGAACGLAQVAATAAGMVPWWALPFTLALTVAVSQPHGPVNQLRARLSRGAGVASVTVFATIIALRSVSEGRQGLIDPTSTLRSLTEALVALSLIMAPSARTPREHRVWLTVTTGVLVAAAAGSRTFSAGALTALSWVVLLVATNRVQVTDAYANGAVPGVIVGMPSKERVSLLGRADTLIPIVATLVAGAVVFLVIPAGLGGGDLARRIARQAEQSGLSLTDRDQVGVDTQGFGDLSLLVRGSLPNTPLLRVPGNSPVLWRGTFYRVYTGTSWDNSTRGQVPLPPIPGPTAAVPTIPDDPLPTHGATLTEHVDVEANADLIWAPGVPIGLSGEPGQVRAVVRGDDNVRVYSDPGLRMTSYTVKAVVPPTDPATLQEARGTDPAGDTWTSLPASVPDEVSALAHQVTAGAQNRYQIVTDIENYLRAHERYSLNTPVPARGEDAVDQFLFHSHVGFCELFASAEAVMLRTLGIPARVVSGLAYGVPDGSSRLYTAANAHAWVEAYYPGVGWSPSDPTAGVSLADTSTNSPSLFSRAFDALASAIPGGRLVVAVIGAALLVLIGWVVRRAVVGRRRGGGRGRRGLPKPPGPVLAAFLRMTKSRHGPPPRAPAETPRQYLARVGGPRPEVGAAVLALEQELYGQAPPSDAETQAAIATFDALVSSDR